MPPAVDETELLRLLSAALGATKISTDPDDLAVSSHDALRLSRSTARNLPEPVLPLAVVRPEGTADVCAAVRFASSHQLPIVPLGGATGLMGGGRSLYRGIALDLRSMSRVLEVGREDRSVRVQAGAVLADVNAALEPFGLMLGHDPWTVPIATVGGTISTNGLGYRGAQYGSMGDQVLGLEVVLGDGSMVQVRPAARSSTGPRLKHLWAGAEGTLGVITEAELRVFPMPERRRLIALEFPDFDSGFHAVESMFAVGLTPSMIDFGQTYAGSRADGERFTPAGCPGRMQLAFEGYRELVAAASARALRICRQWKAERLDSSVARRFWQQRHVVAERIRRRAEQERESWIPEGMLGDFVHVSLPASRVLEYRDRALALLTDRDISIREWGLWNQPELFSVGIQCRVRSPEDASMFAASADALVRLAQEMGGSMEYCHGAGLRLAPMMEEEHGRAIRVLHGIKTLLDPDGILNPGKLGLGPPCAP